MTKKSIGAICLLISAAGALSAQQLTSNPLPPGKLVELGGYRLHLYCTGAGSPTVLLSPGGGDYSVDWALVQPRVARFARVCSYDRSGDAWSDAGPAPNTMRQEVSDLHRALEKSGDRGPYILVGHSIGGLVMRIFAENFPRDVAGLVLVDATSEDTTLSMNGKLVHMRTTAKDVLVPDVQTIQSSPPAPLTDKDVKDFVDFRKQFGAPKIAPPYNQLPPEAQNLDLWARSQMPKATSSDNYFAEELQFLYLRAQQAPPPLGDKPLISIVAGRLEPAPRNVSADEWHRLVNEKVDQKKSFALLSSNSSVVMDEKAGHHIQLDDPDAVVNAIRATRDAAQNHAKLPQ